jgi:hypothetical protein
VTIAAAPRHPIDRGVRLADLGATCGRCPRRGVLIEARELNRHPTREQSPLAGFQYMCVLRRHSYVIAAVMFAVVFAGCDSGKSGRAQPSRSASGEALAATAKTAQQAAPYTARPLDAFGSVTTVVEIDGSPPADTVIQPPVDLAVACGPAFTRRGVERSGARAAGVVVWIDGLRSGKPLPIDRRFQVTTDRCVLFPEIQPALAGGTLNVENLDATDHRTRITRVDGGDVLATIRQGEEGQVVPNERVLAKPGVLQVTCDVHAWMRAWIAVFDHPYFGTTGRDGAFTLDSVPPGRYAVRAWHPRLGAVSDSVTIEAGKMVTLTLHAKAMP